MSAQAWTCADADAGMFLDPDSGQYVPTCVGAGEWVQLPTNWWAAEIPTEQVPALLGALLMFAAVVYVCRMVLKAEASRD